MEKQLKNKVIVNFGDSIFGNFRAPEDISTFIAEQTGATVYNVGFGGCRMSTHPSRQFDPFCMYRLADAVSSGDFTLQNEAFTYEPRERDFPEYFKGSLELLESIDFSKVDIITIAYGTNDFTGGQRIDSEDKYDITAFGSALRYSIEKIMGAYPHLKIAVCSLTYRFWRDAEGVVLNDSNTLYKDGFRIPDFNKKAEEIANEYGLFFIDNYNGPVINIDNRNICFSDKDGTHPMIPGRRLIAENIAKNLIKKFG